MAHEPTSTPEEHRALAEQHIGAADLTVLHVVEQPAEVCAIVDAAHQRQRERSTRLKRRTTIARST
ncbi:MAG TPA: hypothetical protein VG147_15940 [Solirubrobacteraceae bacterium]|nr:hypothetical protein [Solirubrobacteraceae bacterium]